MSARRFLFHGVLALLLPLRGGAQEMRPNPLRVGASRPEIKTATNPARADSADYKALRDKLCSQALENAAVEKWEPALALATQALEIQQVHLGAEQPEALGILESIAVWQDRSAQYAAAGNTWFQLKLLCAKVHGEQHWSVLNAGLFGEVCAKASQLDLQDQQRLGSASVLAFRAERFIGAAKYADASGPARESLESRRALLGDDNAATVISSHLLGTSLLAQGDYPAAKPLLEQCATTREQLCGLKNPFALATLTSLSVLYMKLDEPAQCRQTLEKLLNGNSGVYGPIHPITVAALYELGSFELDQNNLATAETILELVKTQRIKLYRGKHVELAQVCKRLGRLYLKKQDIPQAEENLKAALRLYQALAGKDHPDAARTLVELAVVEKLARNSSDAILHLQSAIEIFSTALGNDAADTIDAMHVLAVTLPDVGDHAQAERLYRRVIELYQKTLPENDLRIGLVNMQLGTLYVGWDDLGSAEIYLRRALAIYEQSAGKRHPDTAGILSLLAMVDGRSGRFRQATQEATDALGICKNTLGEQHSQTFAATLALANVLVLESKPDDAQKLYEQVLNAQPLGTEEERYQNAIVREKLASIALQKGRYDEAISSANAVLKVYAERMPASHPHRLEPLKIAAIANLALHRDELARQQIEELVTIARAQLDAAAVAQSERQQLALTMRLRVILDLQLSLPPNQIAAEKLYANVLQWKGAVQARQIRQRQQLKGEDLEVARELQETVTRMATLSLRVPEGSERKAWNKQLEDLKHRKESLEAVLAQHSDVFQADRAAAAIKVAELQAALPADAVLIDVLKYAHFFGSRDAGSRDETRYVAFVLRKDRIQRIELGPATKIEAAIETCREKCLFAANNTSALELSKLADLIWKPLAAETVGCRTVLYSPDANLARFPLAALPGEKPGTYLIEDFAIGLIPVPRMLPEYIRSESASRETSPELLLVGNVDYNAAAGQTDADELHQLSKENLGGELLTFEPLKSAPEEMQMVQAQFKRRYPTGQLQVLQQAAATEAAFRHEAPQARWLFLATHGYFAPPNVSAALAVQDQLIGIGADQPTSRSGALCGMALAGANLAHGANADDGLLTAYEVSALDLRKLELVVLSGCETGLGESTPGEGAMSLQRAFQVAGARTTVASLWSVPDEPTKELMQRFLHNLWEQRMPKLEALRAAQIEMLHSPNRNSEALASTRSSRQNALRTPAGKGTATETKAPPKLLPPYYWAAFVMSGNWR